MKQNTSGTVHLVHFLASKNAILYIGIGYSKGNLKIHTGVPSTPSPPFLFLPFPPSRPCLSLPLIPFSSLHSSPSLRSRLRLFHLGGLGSAARSSSGVWGGAPAEIDFVAF